MIVSAEPETGAYRFGTGAQARYLRSCIWGLLTAPAMHEIYRAHRWWSKGELEVLYPSWMPAALVLAIDAFDAGLTAGQAARMKRDLEKVRHENTAGIGRMR